MDIKMEQLSKKYELGALKSSPVPVMGGLLHKMYHVTTDKGEYAIKALNPDIMQRPEALQNMVNSETISNALKETISLVAAKELEGKHIVEYDNFFFMVFDWLEGKSIFCPDILPYHCEAVGSILGKIHKANIVIEGMEREQNQRSSFAWDTFWTEAEKQKVSWLSEYTALISKLKQWDKQILDSWQALSEHQVISHRDLDPKNMMWQQGLPCVIDWEAAGYVNPFQELIEVLNYWIVDVNGEYSKEKFDALMQAYKSHMDIQTVNWDAALSSGFDGMLGWLEYNLKRALGLEGSKPEDRQEGEVQVLGTLNELQKYELHTVQLREWLNRF